MIQSTLVHWLKSIALNSENTCFNCVTDCTDLVPAIQTILSQTKANRRHLVAANYENEHWLLVIVHSGPVDHVISKAKILFMDPLRLDPVFYSKALATYIKNSIHPRNFLELSFPVQSLQSSLCGVFVIYFAYAYCKLRQDLPSIERQLSSLSSSDQLVAQWYSDFTSTPLE